MVLTLNIIINLKNDVTVSTFILRKLAIAKESMFEKYDNILAAESTT